MHVPATPEAPLVPCGKVHVLIVVARQRQSAVDIPEGALEINAFKSAVNFVGAIQLKAELLVTILQIPFSLIFVVVLAIKV
jgi:hypothetical protein